MSQVMRRKLLSVIQSDDVTDGSGGKRDSTSKSVQVDCGTVTKVLFSRKWQRLFLYIIVLFGFVSILGLATIANLAATDWHAECFVEYYFGAPCSYIGERIGAQFILWDENSKCGPGVRCNYHLIYQNNDMIFGTHSSANFRHQKNVTFWFAHDKYDRHACKMYGHSRSNNLFTMYDAGSNYCGLHNIVKGAKLLDGHISSDESSSNADCSYYVESNCERADL